ncbi:MAG: hypothetical protein AAFX05_08090 [Planctomycetota bacterium]
MPRRPQHVISICIVGDAMTVAEVESGPFGARTRDRGTIDGISEAHDEEFRQILGNLPQRARLVLTCSSGVCAIRPIPLGVQSWRAAEEEVTHSVARLLPLSPDDAMLGLVERVAPQRAVAHDSDATAQGYLVGVRRSVVEALVERIESISGRSVTTVLSPHMAMMGLGLQHVERATLIDTPAPGVMMAHHFEWGQPVELDLPWAPDASDAAALAGTHVRSLPNGDGRTPPGAEPITALELAIGAAIACSSDFGRFIPLTGRRARSLPRWLLPASLTAAAVALIMVAGSVENSRYERAAVEVRRQLADLEAQAKAVQQSRARFATLSSRMKDGVAPTVSAWRPVMPDLVEARRTIPEDGFLYRIRLSSDRVTLNGESQRAASVLRAMEDSTRFADARQGNPPIAIEERGTETFDVTALLEPEEEGGVE